MKIAFIILLLAFTFITAWIDANHFKKGHYVEDHKPRWYMRAYSLLLVLPFSLVCTIGGSLIFWSLFDHVLNKLRKLPFKYIGGTSKIDLFFKDRKALYYILKLISLSAGVGILFM